jgi:hypothetical protein
MQALLAECRKPDFSGTLILKYCAGELVGVEQSNSLPANYDGPPGRETRQQA